VNIRIALLNGKINLYALNSAHGRVSWQIRSTEKIKTLSAMVWPESLSGALTVRLIPPNIRFEKKSWLDCSPTKGGDAQISTAQAVVADRVREGRTSNGDRSANGKLIKKTGNRIPHDFRRISSAPAFPVATDENGRAQD
jgi:hypothetical protein